MVEVIGRLKWVALLALAIILTYRFTDSVWGSFAYPFYMGTTGGALGHTATEVALASKMVGVVATIVGIVGGGILLKVIGRLPALVLAGVLAAATNLLFYDLAVRGPVVSGLVNLLFLDDLFAFFGQDVRNAALITAIMGENLAVGFASVAYVAYLSGIVNPKYAAVQYALFGSLTLLIGNLGKPMLGAYIESDGFGAGFIVVTMIGIIPVFLTLGEWYRVSQLKKPADAAPTPQAAE
jgi:PAT family beta-lactamase induction signal transducer AmpG